MGWPESEDNDCSGLSLLDRRLISGSNSINRQCGDFQGFSSEGGGSYNVTPAVTTIGYLSLELGPGALR